MEISLGLPLQTHHGTYHTSCPYDHACLFVTHLPICSSHLYVGAYDGAVRLIGGSSQNEGHVEFHYRGVWRAVCDSTWNITNGNVVCQQLGFPGAIRATRNSYFPFSNEESSMITLSDTHCSGNEPSLALCRNSWQAGGCNSSHHAGVICKGTCVHFTYIHWPSQVFLPWVLLFLRYVHLISFMKWNFSHSSPVLEWNFIPLSHTNCATVLSSRVHGVIEKRDAIVAIGLSTVRADCTCNFFCTCNVHALLVHKWPLVQKLTGQGTPCFAAILLILDQRRSHVHMCNSI